MVAFTWNELLIVAVVIIFPVILLNRKDSESLIHLEGDCLSNNIFKFINVHIHSPTVPSLPPSHLQKSTLLSARIRPRRQNLHFLPCNPSPALLNPGKELDSMFLFLLMVHPITSSGKADAKRTNPGSICHLLLPPVPVWYLPPTPSRMAGCFAVLSLDILTDQPMFLTRPY